MATTTARQLHITTEQVRCKIQEAKMRAQDALTACQQSTTDTEYQEALRAMYKAANDLKNWKIVLRALTS